MRPTEVELVVIHLRLLSAKQSSIAGQTQTDRIILLLASFKTRTPFNSVQQKNGNSTFFKIWKLFGCQKAKRTSRTLSFDHQHLPLHLSLSLYFLYLFISHTLSVCVSFSHTLSHVLTHYLSTLSFFFMLAIHISVLFHFHAPSVFSL